MTEQDAPPGADLPPAGTVPFVALTRQPTFRTSDPTNDEVRGAMLAVRGRWQAEQSGRPLSEQKFPWADIVILAALRLVGNDALYRETKKVRAEFFPPSRPRRPRQPRAPQ